MVILVCAIVFAVLFGIWGLLHGGLARLFAHKWHRSPEKTAGQAFVVGAAGGGVFSAITGVLVGSLVGYVQGHVPAGVGITIAFLLLLGFIAGVAIVLGLVGYLLEWLGVSEEEPELPAKQPEMLCERTTTLSD